jgi:hypothetical protein
MEKFFFGCFIVWALSVGFYAWKARYYWGKLCRYIAKERPDLLKEFGLDPTSPNPLRHILT